MRVWLLTSDDASDRRAWSGVPFHMRESLSELADVRVAQVGVPHLFVDRALLRVCKKAGRKYLLEGSIAASRAAGRAASRALRTTPADVIVAVAATSQVAMLSVDQPVVHVNDATFRLLEDYYPYTTDLCLASSLQAEWVERRALRRADACVFPSAWAAESAIGDYGVDSRSMHIVEFGACITPASPPGPAVRRPGRSCQMLFIATDAPSGTSHGFRVAQWERKGGSQTVRVLDELIARGYAASLSIIGDVPVDLAGRADIRLWGRLNPNRDEAREILSQEYRRADVLVYPSPAACTGIPLLDAAAHGLPVIAAETGGVPSVVVAGETGILLPVEATPARYATAVERIMARGEHEKMSRMARLRYETTLNWRRWAERTMEIAEDLVATRRRPATGHAVRRSWV